MTVQSISLVKEGDPRFISTVGFCFTCSERKKTVGEGIQIQTIDGKDMATLIFERPKRLSRDRLLTWRYDEAAKHDRLHQGRGTIVLVRAVCKLDYPDSDDAVSMIQMIRAARGTAKPS